MYVIEKIDQNHRSPRRDGRQKLTDVDEDPATAAEEAEDLPGPEGTYVVRCTRLKGEWLELALEVDTEC